MGQTLDNYFAKRPIKPIFHYTSAAGAIGIMQNRELWASSGKHLNDALESVEAKDWLDAEIKRRNPKKSVKEALDKAMLATAMTEEAMPQASRPVSDDGFFVYKLYSTRPSPFITSFSEERDLLSQWRAYCPSGDGFSLGFDMSQYVGDAFFSLALVKCVYTNEERDFLCSALLESFEDPTRGLDEHLRACMMVLGAVKHSSFIEEDEWRLIGIATASKTSFRPGRHGIVPFKKVPIQEGQQPQLVEAVIGPNTDSEAAERAIEEMANALNFQNLAIGFSTTPFRG